MFALMFVALALFVGAAVDIGRWSQARNQTAAALDAAVLAGARMLQLDRKDVDGAIKVAQQYYAENTKGRTEVFDSTPTFNAINNNSGFTGTSHAYMKTSFLGFARVSTLPLNIYSEAALPDKPLEIAMMLDVTGSMKGDKIEDLKLAATDLVNIVIPDGGSAKVRVSLVPFAETVRLPATSVSKAMGSPVKVVKKTSGSGNNQRTYFYNRSEDCVVERAGHDKYTDAAPGTGSYVLPFRKETARVTASQVSSVLIDNSSSATEGSNVAFQWKSGSGLKQSEKDSLTSAANSFASCPVSTAGTLVPLTKDKTLLKNKINGLELAGSTAGQIGTAWAWYTLSPNWNTLWDTSSAATAYGGDTQKIAILMTDGEYNMQYDSNGISTGATGAGSAANTDSSSQARALCTEMKKKVMVYTVGFALGGNQTAIDTLNHCATNASMAYKADNGDELQQAFRDIALKINQLYLTQ
jgi:Flp pilus assembly protein TadG